MEGAGACLLAASVLPPRHHRRSTLAGFQHHTIRFHHISGRRSGQRCSGGSTGSATVCGQTTREKMAVIASVVVKFVVSALTFAYSGELSTARACSTLSNQYSVML